MPNVLAPAPAGSRPPLAASGSAPVRPAPSAVEPLLDAEKLDLYRVALEFQELAARLLPRRASATLRDQLERASVSIVLNVAEGAGRTSPPDKARFIAIARGSATECAAILDVLLARGLAHPTTYRRGRALLVRVVQMATKLNARLLAAAKAAHTGSRGTGGTCRATPGAAG